VATSERNSRGFGSSHELNEGLRKAIEHFINLIRARNPHNPAAVSAEPQMSGTVKDATLDLARQALDARDPYTASHSSRVSELTGLLGEHLGLGDREVELLRAAGSLHDLGMIGVRDDVLNKPGSLNDEEREVMRRHPDIGADMLAQHPALAEVATLVRHHHESWDGGGYPAGLKGDVIPFGARILAVADSFDAITSARFFIRSAMTPIEAVDDISRRAGHRYDPIVVNALRELHGLRPQRHSDQLLSPDLYPDGTHDHNCQPDE
jgi:HD-GYP domain-containing protein (c-di-GMP phosphodiesterase class II)